MQVSPVVRCECGKTHIVYGHNMKCSCGATLRHQHFIHNTKTNRKRKRSET